MQCRRRIAQALLTVVLCFGVAISIPTNRPHFVECINSRECGPRECCVLGMSRYSIPKCTAHPENGDFCWPGMEGPFNATLTYPGDQTVSFINIHRMSCPCTEGLMCGRNARCINPALPMNDNRLHLY